MKSLATAALLALSLCCGSGCSGFALPENRQDYWLFPIHEYSRMMKPTHPGFGGLVNTYEHLAMGEFSGVDDYADHMSGGIGGFGGIWDDIVSVVWDPPGFEGLVSLWWHFD